MLLHLDSLEPVQTEELKRALLRLRQRWRDETESLSALIARKNQRLEQCWERPSEPTPMVAYDCPAPANDPRHRVIQKQMIAGARSKIVLTQADNVETFGHDLISDD